MRRGEFITLLGGVAAWPLPARAQQAERVRRIGVQVSGGEADPETQARLAALREGLGRFGWSQGRNLGADYRFAAADGQRMHVFMARRSAALGTQPAVARQRQTGNIPIVFIGAGDPIRAGLVASLARPGGNLTGTLLCEDSIVGKWLAMLKEIAPQTTRVTLLFNPKTTTPIYATAAQAIPRRSRSSSRPP
jgi:putative ABC transport system substrate-binding protein